ncbi:hypothetical protein C8T65DRAFT_663725 [Cerioporus squamosus]|nr:hypothetical protein C8T65DRAFT_663725 [Cerioporus squamosus]
MPSMVQPGLISSTTARSTSRVPSVRWSLRYARCSHPCHIQVRPLVDLIVRKGSVSQTCSMMQHCIQTPQLPDKDRSSMGV